VPTQHLNSNQLCINQVSASCPFLNKLLSCLCHAPSPLVFLHQSMYLCTFPLPCRGGAYPRKAYCYKNSSEKNALLCRPRSPLARDAGGRDLVQCSIDGLQVSQPCSRLPMSCLGDLRGPMRGIESSPLNAPSCSLCWQGSLAMMQKT
jgi:hypothetical protein